MDSPDQSFFEEYKPLHVPHEYKSGACSRENIIFALAQLGEGTASEVATKLSALEPGTNPSVHQKNSEDVLSYLFDKGLIKAVNKNGELSYNLSKIEVQNSGKADSLF
jgi:hypothetical protein